MLLNLGLNQLAPSLDPSLRKAPNIIAAPQQPDVNIDALLNLSQSKYDGLKRVGDTDYYYGNNRMYTPSSFSGGKGAPSGLTNISGQNFVPVDEDITGFNKSKAEGSDYYTYDPSMAYISANRPRAIPEPTPNVMSFLLPPLMNLQPAETSYGAGRFLNNSIPLNSGINSSPINTNRYTPTITSNEEGFDGYGDFRDAKISFGMPIGSPSQLNNIQTLGDFLNIATFTPRVPIGNNTELNFANMPFYSNLPIGNTSKGNEQ